MITSFYLMLNLPAASWLRSPSDVIGFGVYFLDGAQHSRLITDPNY